MNRLLLVVLVCFCLSANSQRLTFGLSAGTGKSYIIETLDNVDVHYGLPLSLSVEAKYKPLGKKWGVKLRVHSIESTLTGKSWVDNSILDGYISSLTTSILLENEIQKSKYSYGFNLGFGISKETIQQNQFASLKNINVYNSISLSTHFNFKISSDIDFQILPTILWQDPFKSIGVITKTRKANLAQEDISMTINFGIRYKLLN
jgi:hypothetical protein